MARGVFTNVIPNSDLTVSAGSLDTGSLNIGSDRQIGADLNSTGALSLQFSCSDTIDSVQALVRADETVPWILLSDSEDIIASAVAAGDYIFSVTVPLCSEIKYRFATSGTALVSNIRMCAQ